jgi:hypothetical protein
MKIMEAFASHLEACLSGCALLLAFTPFPGFAATPSTGIDEQADLPFWQIEDEGMSLRLVQRMPDQSRAFFMARGFDQEQVEQVAGRCVFQTVFRNLSHIASPSTLRYRQQDWVASHAHGTATIMTRERWHTLWEKLEAPAPARIAFQWSLLPTEQTYEPGDYNWGMTMIDLAPGSRFDLKVVWEQFGETRATTIEDLQCAADTPTASTSQ